MTAVLYCINYTDTCYVAGVNITREINMNMKKIILLTVLISPVTAVSGEPVAYDYGQSKEVRSQVTSQLHTQRVAGGIAVIDTGIMDIEPSVQYNGKKCFVYKARNGSYVAVVGIHLLTNEKETQTVTVNNTAVEFPLEPWPYKEVEDASFSPTELTSEQKVQLDREKKELAGVKGNYRDVDIDIEKLVWPVTGSILKEFGVRVKNGDKLYRPHTAVDITAAAGTAVAPISTGVVTYVGVSVIHGNVVYVDHGKGLISSYGNLAVTSVRKGDVVTPAQAVGVVGVSGLRSTVPHVHFSIHLNGFVVDPTKLLPERSVQ